mgnify:CR=1 FL=1
MANSLTIDQTSTLLREVLKEATGQETLTALDTNQLLTLGQKTLSNGYDPVINAVTQVISRTIFSNRPYKRKFASLRMTPEKWGNIVRKIVPIEREDNLQDNGYLPLTDNESVDQYKIKKGKAVQLNFYGQQTYELVLTIFDNQLDTAFNSAADFAAFMGSMFTQMLNKIEKIHEETARATVSGFIAGKIAGDTSNVVHLITEYNAATGAELDATTVYAPANFAPFMRWVYARINSISRLMTEYSIKFHTNLSDGVIYRHTPEDMQKAYFYAPLLSEMESRVLADTYHDTLLKLPGAEMVNFWQNIDSPDEINVKTPNYLGADGTIKTASADVKKGGVFGVLFDIEAMGYCPVMERVTTTPYNARGEYRNQFWKFNERNYIDYTENGVVFLLD